MPFLSVCSRTNDYGSFQTMSLFYGPHCTCEKKERKWSVLVTGHGHLVCFYRFGYARDQLFVLLDFFPRKGFFIEGKQESRLTSRMCIINCCFLLIKCLFCNDRLGNNICGCHGSLGLTEKVLLMKLRNFVLRFLKPFFMIVRMCARN